MLSTVFSKMATVLSMLECVKGEVLINVYVYIYYIYISKLKMICYVTIKDI